MLTPIVFLSSLLLAPLVVASPAALHSRGESGVLIRTGDGSPLCLSYATDGFLGSNRELAYTGCDNPGFGNNPRLPNIFRRWDLTKGASSVIRATGTNFCLQSLGDGFSNFASLRVDECSASSTQFFATADQRIAVAGGNQCLDIDRSQTARNGGFKAQTYECTTGNTNQVWTLPQDTDTSVPSATTTATLSAVATATSAPTTSNGVYIHPNGDNTVCLTVKDAAKNGDPVTVARCNTSNGVQHLFDISKGDGLVRLSNSNLCLDAGSKPGNNVGMKVWQCYPGLAQQQFYYTDDNRIALTGGNQCLDLTNGVKDINKPTQVQTYVCSSGNTNQIWTSNLISYVQ